MTCATMSAVGVFSFNLKNFSRSLVKPLIALMKKLRLREPKLTLTITLEPEKKNGSNPDVYASRASVQKR